jgi:hypothetical protein
MLQVLMGFVCGASNIEGASTSEGACGRVIRVMLQVLVDGRSAAKRGPAEQAHVGVAGGPGEAA